MQAKDRMTLMQALCIWILLAEALCFTFSSKKKKIWRKFHGIYKLAELGFCFCNFLFGCFSLLLEKAAFGAHAMLIYPCKSLWSAFMLLHSLCWCWEGYREIGRVVAIGIMSDFVFRQPVVAVLTSLFINTAEMWFPALLSWSTGVSRVLEGSILQIFLLPWYHPTGPAQECLLPSCYTHIKQIWNIPCQMNIILDYSKHIQLLIRECILSWCAGIRSKITEQVAGTVLTFTPAAEVS